MVEIWFAILCLMLTIFAILDGWDIGAGALHLLVAKTDAERRAVVAAIGPLWTWHEVWLVAAGGVLFVAFPRALASAFAGFYLALFLLLWSFVLRGISLEFGGHVEDGLWRSFWDFVFGVSSAFLAVLLGVALGNVVRGVPLDEGGRFTLPFFTDFGVRGWVGILDWYTLSIGAFTLLALAAHGASYLAVKTEGSIRGRSERIARRLWVVVIGLLLPVTAETAYVRPEMFGAMARRPVAWFAVALAAGGAAVVIGARGAGRDLRVFLGGCALLAGLLSAAGSGLFPVMLHSTLAPEHSMSAYDGSAGEHSLRVAIVWWPIALLLSIACAVFVLRHYRGRVRPGGDQERY